MMIMGGLSGALSLTLVLPMRAISSSLTILMTCCAGLRDLRISCPTAFSLTLLMKSLATNRLTSASKSATRTSRMACLISSSESLPRAFILEKI